MTTSLHRGLAAAAVAFSWYICETEYVHADVITFESIPGVGAPTDGMAINTQFQSTFGVTFSMEGGRSPVLAEVGGPRTAFEGYYHLPDQPAPGVDAGRFFLTDDGVVGPPPPPLIVAYSSAMASAGGIVLDIDGTEAWRIEARNSLNAIIDTVNLGPNNVLDGSATAWSFNHASADIYSIRMVYIGSQTNGVGFAFDNFSQSSEFSSFSPIPTPEPSSIVLFGTGALSIAALRRRRPNSVARRSE